jgi:hypothetical protein
MQWFTGRKKFCGKFCKKKRKVQIYSAMIGRAVILFNIYYSRRERMMPRSGVIFA